MSRQSLATAAAAETKTTAITAAGISWNSIFMSQTSDLIAQDSTIVIRRSSLQDRHYENHQKHRHAFARGLPNRRWSFRVRLESGSSHLPTLPCRTGGGHLYSHRKIELIPSPTSPAGFSYFKYLSNHATVCSSRSPWCLGSMNMWPSPG